MDTLFRVISAHGSLFHVDLWDLIFKGVLFPIFDAIEIEEAEKLIADSEWIQSTCHKALHLFVELFIKYYSVVGHKFNSLLQLLCRCVRKGNHFNENQFTSDRILIFGKDWNHVYSTTLCKWL